VKARGQVREGLRYVRNIPDLWLPLAMVAVIGTLTFNFSVVMPLFVERTLHGTDASFTLIFSVLSLGSLVGALAAARRRSIDLRAIVVAAAAFGAAMLVFAAAPDLAGAFPLALLLGFASVSFMTVSTAIVQVRALPPMRGRVIAIQSMLLLGSTPIGGPLLGAICDAYGARAGLVVGGVAALAAAGWGFLKGRRVISYRIPARPAGPLLEGPEAAGAETA